MEQSLGYYVDGLGFTLKNKWVVDGKLRWCWLTFGDVALMLQGPANKVVGDALTLCFTCEDAVQLYHEFRSRGIDASEPQVGNSMWVTDLTDPDGYRLFFESPTDAQEETKLSQL